MKNETLIYARTDIDRSSSKTNPPETLWATFDRRHGYMIVHQSRVSAQKEQDREPGMIDIIEYRLKVQ